jgi:DNA repair exonuclease SbcCD ATPase subunit
MRLDPKTRVLAWRSEIAAELEAAQKELPPLEATHAAAIAETQDVLEDYRDLQHFLNAKLPLNFISGTKASLELSLQMRSEDLRAEVEPAKTRQARANNDLEAARGRVAKLQRALAQIDQIIPPAEESERENAQEETA